MMYLAVAGLASNFGAVKALVSVGIQQGHMKMHLSNILNQLHIPEEKRADIQLYFQDKTTLFCPENRVECQPVFLPEYAVDSGYCSGAFSCVLAEFQQKPVP